MTFLLAATFPDEEQALHAETQMAELIDTIFSWHLENFDRSEALFNAKGEMVKVSPPEKEAARRYGIAWAKGHVWLVDDMLDPEDIVQRYQTTVYLLNPLDYYDDPTPLDIILKKLGAESVRNVADTAYLTVTIRATAPDDNAASRARSILTTFFETRGIAPAPWAVYLNGEFHQDVKDAMQHETLYLRHMDAIEAVDDTEYETLEEAEDALFSAMAGMDEIDEEAVGILDDARLLSSPYRPPHGKVRQTGTQLTLANIGFYVLGSGLPAVIAWLESLGFDSIDVELP
jgi:hypothetical protein